MIDESLAGRLQSEQTIWLTTVRADGTPVPTPVWFLWDGNTFLIFTQAESRKLRNITDNPHVALNFNTDEWGGSVAVFTGKAFVDDQPAPADQLEAYLAKYREGIKMIGLTPETMAAQFSTVLRVRPSKVRRIE